VGKETWLLAGTSEKPSCEPLSGLIMVSGEGGKIAKMLKEKPGDILRSVRANESSRSDRGG
jgi:hypothetical protein